MSDETLNTEEPDEPRLFEPEAEPESAEEPEAEPESAEEPEAEPVYGVSWVPFSVYFGAWVVLAVATVIGLRGPALAGGPLFLVPEYAYTVWGGAGLAAFGPILALVVWLVTRSRREPGQRTGLLTSALLRGAGAAFLGAVLWLIALYVLDLYRLGVFA